MAGVSSIRNQKSRLSSSWSRASASECSMAIASSLLLSGKALKSHLDQRITVSHKKGGGGEKGGGYAKISFTIFPWTVGQADVSATEAVGQLFVVDPEQVQDGCMQIVYLQGIFDRPVAPFVGSPKCNAGLHVSPGHPKTESVFVVLLGICFWREDRGNWRLAGYIGEKGG